MADKPPYVNAYGNITKALERIQQAATPPRFTQDFLATKLNLGGGSAKPLIPFLKRSGFIASDGTPTELYKRFRNSSQRGAAAAEAVRIGYKSLYEINEYIHDAKEKDLKGVVVQVTGSEPDSTVVQKIVASFKALRSFADFDSVDIGEESDDDEQDEADSNAAQQPPPASEFGYQRHKLGLSYTINLNLPPTSDVAVFDAIFKSLKENLLK